MKKLTIKYSSIIAAFAVILSSPVFALDLQQARTQGILTEQPDGYVKVAKPSADAIKLASEVNAARKQEYQRISKENGQPVDVIAKIAASEIAKKLSAGK